MEKAEKYVSKEIKKLTKRKIEDFVIRTRLTKNVSEYRAKGPHVMVAEKMIASGEVARKGTLISYVITKGSSKRIGDRAEVPGDVSIEDVDLEYYITHQIFPVLEGIFDIFGKRNWRS